MIIPAHTRTGRNRIRQWRCPTETRLNRVRVLQIPCPVRTRSGRGLVMHRTGLQRSDPSVTGFSRDRLLIFKKKIQLFQNFRKIKLFWIYSKIGDNLNRRCPGQAVARTRVNRVWRGPGPAEADAGWDRCRRRSWPAVSGKGGERLQLWPWLLETGTGGGVGFGGVQCRRRGCKSTASITE